VVPLLEFPAGLGLDRPAIEIASRPQLVDGSVGLKILREVAKAGITGIYAEELATAVGIANPRGLGGAMTALNKRLELHHLAPDDVLRSVRAPAGTLWRPGRYIQQAIVKLQVSRAQGIGLLRALKATRGKYLKKNDEG